MQGGLGHWGLWRSKGPSGFRVNALEGLQLWLQNDTGITNVAGGPPADNDQINGWLDSSGNGRNAVGSGADYPRWSYAERALEFDGHHLLNLSPNEIDILGEFTAFFRIKFGASTLLNSADIVTSDTASNNFIRLQGSTHIRMKLNSAQMNFKWNTNVFTTGNYTTITVTRDSSNNVRCYADGVVAYDLDNSSNYYINQSNFFRINILEGGDDVFLKEVIICSSLLTSNTERDVRTYLEKL